ncbi:hypothetical protein LOY55_09745 [Pseudomonas sp. B21-040]|uniref:hypothetical protein n=1 Tax=Pseudomonas sp. B21-040 TaxID=2895486 RepID=UPI0021602D66|nr:hypothetical protein [Pseudomonas sp. B21-040]UVL42363.1 hypothetical protein LOY55_09745 [Pseudomonas sp. B21-040]
MENDVNIFTTLPREQAGMLLETLRADYANQFNAHWYEERFIAVPEHLRHDALIATFPKMAAQKRLIGALSFSLGRRC